MNLIGIPEENAFRNRAGVCGFTAITASFHDISSKNKR